MVTRNVQECIQQMTAWREVRIQRARSFDIFAWPRPVSSLGMCAININEAYHFMATLLLSSRKSGPFSFLQRSDKRILLEKWQLCPKIQLVAFVRPTFLAFFAYSRQAKFSTLPLPEHWNPWPSHEHPNLFQLLNRKADAGKKKWKAESRLTRTHISREHKNWSRCNSKFFAKISQSSPSSTEDH